MSVDLWDFESTPIPELRTPAAILKEQAEIFNQKMQAKGLFAEVQQRSPKDAAKLGFALDVVVPALADYRLRVVGVSFPIAESYPLRVTSDFGDFPFGADAESEDHLMHILGEILTDASLRTALASLIANSNL
jgi:hypothetical protein